MGERYQDTVDYSKLDPLKRTALNMFEGTFDNVKDLRMRVMPVGGTAAVIDFLDYGFMLAFNVEGLGTKNKIADIIYNKLKNSPDIKERMKAREVYRYIGQDTAAMSLTDLMAVGARPIVYGDIIASGSSDWFDDSERNEELLRGFKIAADLAGCAIPCGETPTLQGVVLPETLDLSGASVGIIQPKSAFIYGQGVKAGDVIYGLPSGGICSNGLTKARRIAEKMPEGYFTELPDGTKLYEALLRPTPILVKPVMEMLDEGVDLHNIIPITGHGWKKLARARAPFTYVVESVPEPDQIFKSLIEFGSQNGFDVSDEENYQVWNMGVFLALIAPQSDGQTIREVAKRYQLELFDLGHVEKGEKKVIIKPKNIEYTDL